MSDKEHPHDKDDYKTLPPGERDTRWRGEDNWSEVRLSAQEAIRHANSRGKKRSSKPIAAFRERPLVFVTSLVAGLVVLVTMSYFLFSSSSEPESEPPSEPRTLTRPSQQEAQTDSQPPDTQSEGSSSVFEQIFGTPKALPGRTEPDSLPILAARVTLRLALAALLTGLLAYRPRKSLPLLQRNPYVAQSQILIAIVASALMMIVADNAARAFGIFAAASMVRFRTNVRDPKEITVLLVSLGIGLATGVGRMELAVILALFVLMVLWVMERYEPDQVVRAMEVTVKTRDVNLTDDVLKEVFEKHHIDAELRKVDHPDEPDDLGAIRYLVNVHPGMSTDQLSEEIFSSDPHNVDSINWDQKKSSPYVYR
ncbi:MAG: DUF4956 domain-containing protein [Blastocatellia bacterium]|nr:DUF4956 domain-containing protein [Blastocatellia bacterium]